MLEAMTHIVFKVFRSKLLTKKHELHKEYGKLGKQLVVGEEDRGLVIFEASLIVLSISQCITITGVYKPCKQSNNLVLGCNLKPCCN